MAISLSAIFQVTLLYMLWNKKSKNEGSRWVYMAYARMIALGAILGLCLEWIKRLIFGEPGTASMSGSLISCVVMTALFILMLLTASHIFKIREISDFSTRLTRRFKKPTPH